MMDITRDASVLVQKRHEDWRVGKLGSPSAFGISAVISIFEESSK